jgi:hypothetical protein
MCTVTRHELASSSTLCCDMAFVCDMLRTVVVALSTAAQTSRLPVGRQMCEHTAGGNASPMRVPSASWAWAMHKTLLASGGVLRQHLWLLQSDTWLACKAKL